VTVWTLLPFWVVVRVLMALVVCSGCIVGAAGTWGGGKSGKQAQQELLDEFTPPGLDIDPVSNDPIKNVQVRVWADEEYRSQNGGWQRTFQQVLDTTNEVLEAKLRIRLVPSYQVWDHRAQPDETLSDRLAALKAQDPGNGVFAVIGLTSSRGIVEATFEEIGIADFPGHHMMLRGYADIEERKQFRDAAPNLSKAQIERFHGQRRMHKTACVVLHELGHNLGVDHEDEFDTMMSHGYSAKATGFSAKAIATMQQTLGGARPTAPVASNGKPLPPRSGRSIHFSVGPSGVVVLNGDIKQGAALNSALQSAARSDPGIEVVIDTVEGAPQTAIDDIDRRARAAGLVYITRN